MENEILKKVKIYSLYMRSKIISEPEPEDIKIQMCQLRSQLCFYPIRVFFELLLQTIF